ncbi:MAG: ABC transporter permease, partial [Alphaproteobacteria bacterium]|nr:ABC transporter permease [Alphaproteobacteria bacterium]
MTALLTAIFGRLPIGWLQLRHNPARFAAALAGVAFANVLVFMQIGFLGALLESIRIPYMEMNADLLISASDANTLADGSPLPRQRMYQVLGVPGVEQATAMLFGKIDWKQPDGTVRTLDVFGIDPTARVFKSNEINQKQANLMLSDTALIDDKTRNVLQKDLFDRIDQGEFYEFETKGRNLTVQGTFGIGGGFAADGHLIVSDQTFLKLFPKRIAGAPNFILVRLSPDVTTSYILPRLRAVLPASDTQIQTLEQAYQKDQNFQTTQKPVGVVFGFGIIIGTLVGVIIVYQVLSTDVADHMREYATFKAMGYNQRFFM